MSHDPRLTGRERAIAQILRSARKKYPTHWESDEDFKAKLAAMPPEPFISDYDLLVEADLLFRRD